MRTILFLGASPSNERRLAIGQEAEQVREVLAQAQVRTLEVQHRFATTYERLRRALLELKPTYVHFSCHGEPEGLVFVDPTGGREMVKNADIIALLAVVPSVEGILINACKSIGLAKALATESRFAIGMSDSIGDAPALAYSKGFYVGLSTDASPRDCHHLGRAAISAGKLSGAAMPELFCGPHASSRSLRALQDKLDALDREIALSTGSTDGLRAQRREVREKMRPTDRLKQGLCFAGEYELLDRIGRGGFATVWKAYDLTLKRPIALKVLHRDLAGQSEERFFRGARAMLRLADHPNVVEILKPKARFEQRAYFVMELLDGDLNDWLKGNSPTPAQILRVIRPIAAALQTAHAQGLVHRDVKPANILLTADGTPKLADFDLVRADDSAANTRTGGLGAFIYAAPECWTVGKEAKAAADQFSLAMTVLCLLHGRPLPSQAFRRTERFIKRLNLSGAVVAVLLQALEDEPADRFESVEAFVDVLSAEFGEAATGEVTTEKTLGSRDEFGEYEDVDIAGVVVRFRRIRADGFMMGSPTRELGRRQNEGPQHHVRLTEDFWLADTGTTQALWQAVAGQNPSRFREPTRPVENVNWNDVQTFIEIANEVHPGLRLRLPTEAQWEFACRAGTASPRYGVLEAVATHNKNSGGKTRSVRKKAPNAWGLFDMLGNVWEWCADLYGSYSADAVTDPTGPARPARDPSRVVRGGSWDSFGRVVRAASRGPGPPGIRHDDLGFRLSRDPAPSAQAPAGGQRNPFKGINIEE